MLREEIAQRFIDRLCATLQYNVNIMDPEGVIIACRDSYRKGTYHDIAHRVVSDRRAEIVVEEGDPRPEGVLPGVNLPIEYHNRVIGVVGITGPPAEVRNVAVSLKTAIETMVEYEDFKDQLVRRQDRKRLLATMLLYDDRVEREEIESLATHLGYQTDLFRLALIIPKNKNLSEQDLQRIVGSNPGHTRQDMSLMTSDGNIVVFRAVDADRDTRIKEIRRSIMEYFENIDHYLAKHGKFLPAFYAVGSLQFDMMSYKRSFHHAIWTSTHVVSNRQSQRVRFFSDHVEHYLRGLLPDDEVNAVCDPTKRLFGSDAIMGFRDTFHALESADMNSKEAAAHLRVHRNTVIHRVNRLRDTCGFDPLHSVSDRRFLSILYSRE